MNIYVGKDWETLERAGASGMFQVVELKNEAGELICPEATDGAGFRNDKELENHLASKYGIKNPEVHDLD